LNETLKVAVVTNDAVAVEEPVVFEARIVPVVIIVCPV
jgi:hypothetical protein